MTSADERATRIRLAPSAIRRGPGRPPLREIADYSDQACPKVLLTVPNDFSHAVLAALRTAVRAGCEVTDDDPRYEDPRWWNAECSRCSGTEWHRAHCRETGSAAVECQHCGVAVVSWKAGAATGPGWWHAPACPLFASRQPDTAETVEVQSKLTASQFRRAGELIGRSLGRYKAWCTGPYVFGDLTVEQAGVLCAYLEDIPVPYERETTRSWRP